MTTKTLGSAIEEAKQILEKAGVWNPGGDAEILAAHVLDIDRADLSPQTSWNQEQNEKFFELVAKRADRIPLGYITGRATLGGIEVMVGPGVFIPRLHTQPMLDWGLEVLRGVEQPLVLDFCTGSGAIALAVAHARPDAKVHGIDIEESAMDYALRNAKLRASAGDTPIHLHLGDVTDPALFSEFTGTVDLLLANPPFVPEGTELLPEWGEHHPRQAIYSGHDGFRVIRSVINHAVRLLRSGGGVAIEHDDPQAEPIRELLEATHVFTDIETLDHHGRPRFTTARKQ